jgi:glycine dehydrogenase subunit 2
MTDKNINIEKNTLNSGSQNKALQLHTPLLFECGSVDKTGVDFSTNLPLLEKEKADLENENFLNAMGSTEELNIYGFSEVESIRHYTRLSQKNYGIDSGFFPLGSCTMKHNPRVNEKVVRLDNIAHAHPMQPESTVQGSLEIMNEVSSWFCKLSGMPAVSLNPSSGAQGELCGMLAIKQALKNNPEKNVVLIPESAHGTNPATAVTCGFKIRNVKTNKDGNLDIEDLKENLKEDVAGIMLTNPNTCGLFEKDIRLIAKLIHEKGAYFYCDGANFNAIVGKIKPGDLGIDAMHINIHKTFSTPHGGGGPGAGPVVFSDKLANFAPLPFVRMEKNGNYKLVTKTKDLEKNQQPIGRIKQFHGQIGLYVRALAYMISLGKEGIIQVSHDAVLNANYMLAKLRKTSSVAYNSKFCMHEMLLTDEFLKDTGVSTLDFAKGLIDAGFHPMTVYFPLVVSGAMLIEPTETESKQTLDEFINVFIALTKEAKNKPEAFKNSPIHSPVGRVDEVKAAREAKLRWVDIK